MPRLPALGVLMLDTRFARLPGDIGNPASYGGAVIYHTVAGADVERIVLTPEVDPALLAPFLDGARALETKGAEIITTSCGFLSVFQDRLAREVSVPVVASSLLLVPLLARIYGPERPIGIVTANSRALSAQHLSAAGITSPVVIGGIERGAELPRALLVPKAEQITTLDPERAAADALAACRGMLDRAPAIPAFVLECTNLQPYAGRIRAATGRPAYGLLDALQFLAAGGRNWFDRMDKISHSRPRSEDREKRKNDTHL